MNPKYFVSILIIFILIAGSFISTCAYNELSSPSSITGQGTVPFTPQALVDNFDTGVGTNAWNCATGTFNKKDTAAVCTATYTNNPAIVYGGTGHSLQLDYNVDAGASYAGYASQLGGGSLTSPTAYKAISFWVKGAAGGEFFKIQLKDNSATLYNYSENSVNYTYKRSEASIYITDYLDGGVTTTWQQVWIPLDNFVNLDDWSSMKELDIVFENAQSVLNGIATHGTIYIDNIRFETTVNPPAVTNPFVRIDHFGDNIGVCALGGNMGTSTPAGYAATTSYAFSSAANEYFNYPYGLKLVYDVTPSGSWAAIYLIFGGGNDVLPDANKGGWVAIPHDFSAYNYLSFKVRAKSDTENPIKMRIELADNSGARVYNIRGITTSFQTFQLALSSFVDPNNTLITLNKANIKKLTFVFENSAIAGTTGANKTGTVFIDNVEFDR